MPPWWSRPSGMPAPEGVCKGRVPIPGKGERLEISRTGPRSGRQARFSHPLEEISPAPGDILIS